MTTKLLLDTNVLARLCHPTRHRDVQEWFRAILSRGALAPEILVSVLADYELRRTLRERDARESMLLLDRIASAVRYLPVTHEAVRQAVEIRANAKQIGAGDLSDADAIMAAQSQLEGAVLVTNDAVLQRLPDVIANDWGAVAV